MFVQQICTILCRSPPRERGYGAPRYRSPVRSRRPAPTTGLHIFAAGLNFIINERVRQDVLTILAACATDACAHAASGLTQDLERKFEKYGPVREARIVRNPRSGESRGFGFLIMENDDDVDRVSVISWTNWT